VIAYVIAVNIFDLSLHEISQLGPEYLKNM